MPWIIFTRPLPTEYHELFFKEKLHSFLCSYNGIGGGEVQKFRIKEPPVLGIWEHLELKNCQVRGSYFFKSDSKNRQLQVFQKLQRTTKFHERTGKDLSVFGGYLKKNSKTFENYSYIW
jgi:hypothetical protein